MPSTRCVVQDCNMSNKNTGISLHKSPNDKALRRIWVKFVEMKRANFHPSSRESCFTICLERLFYLNGVSRRLKPGAAPSIWRKSPEQITTRDRRKVSSNINTQQQFHNLSDHS